MDSYICSLLFNSICRVSVPIFFMISGALLLEQPVDFKKNNNRTISMLTKTIVWIMVYIVWDYFYLGERYNIKSIFTVPVRVHFWFMYVMIGICITTPLWQKMVSGDSKSFMKYFTVVFILVMAVTFVLNRMKMSITYEIPLFGNSCYAGYFIMGYFIRHYIDDLKINKWICVAVLLSCISITTILTYNATIKIGRHYEGFSDFRSVFIGVSAMIVFYLVMKMKSPKPRIWISFFSKHSFNIYMMHVFFLDILQQNINVTRISSWLGTPIFFVFMLSLSVIMSWLYERINGNKKSILK